MPRKKGITDKQARFIAEYLIDSNASRAAKRAGYSKRSSGRIGQELLQKTHVRAELRKRQTKIDQKLELSAERVLEEYKRLAYSDFGDLADWTPSGVTFKPSAELSENTRRCISEVSQTLTEHGGTMRVKLHDKKGALDALAKHLGMFDELGKPLRKPEPLGTVVNFNEDDSAETPANHPDDHVEH